MNRIMLDLETMGNGSNAAIVSIGAVHFDVDEGITDTFHLGVDLESSVASGGVMDASTVMWWLEQSRSARESLSKLEKHSLLGALSEFAYWATKRESEAIDEVWGCGAAADNVWLANAYRRIKTSVPWSFWADRCYRTMRAMFPEIERLEFVGTGHDALDDATNQALHLIEILKHIRAKGTPE